MKNELFSLSVKECREGLRNKQFSCQELIESYAKRIEQNRDLNVYVYETLDKARTHAKISDDNIAKGNIRELEGIPLGVKDLYCTKDIRTTACSEILKNFVPPYESAITEKLWNEGALMLGKLNMDEFAMGGTNTTSCFGPVKNYHDKTRIAGGSSGGSASAMAASMACATLGSETGDSIRTPAAMCGVVGFKPSYGRCSRYGMISYTSSMDQGGPITRNVEDAAIIMKYMAGYDKRDCVSAELSVPDYEKSLNKNIKGMKIGIVKEFMNLSLNPEVYKSFNNSRELMKKAGAAVQEISIPDVIYSGQIYAVLANCEVSSNLSRFDGVRFGHRTSKPGNLENMYTDTRGEGFGREIKKRLVIGAYMLSAEQYDRYFLQAQKIRRKIYNEFIDAFKKVDVIFSPVIPDRPNTIEEVLSKANDVSRKGNLIDLLTVPMSMAGVPCISVPAGKVNGMPTGMQFAAARFNEEAVFHAGFALEQLLKEGV